MIGASVGRHSTYSSFTSATTIPATTNATTAICIQIQVGFTLLPSTSS
jgi:hypothetical protein